MSFVFVRIKSKILGFNIIRFLIGVIGLSVQNSRMLLDRLKWNKLSSQSTVLIELGAGNKNGINGWVTVDFAGSDICHDLRNGIPLPNESVDRIYTSHMFEHMPYVELVKAIKECYRVLKNGGELSVCVPNAGKYIRAYVEGNIFDFSGRGYRPAFVETGSLIDQVNYIAYMGGEHKYMFDDENLVNTLKAAPFKSVVLRDFDSAIDLAERKFESIYASAKK